MFDIQQILRKKGKWNKWNEKFSHWQVFIVQYLQRQESWDLFSICTPFTPALSKVPVELSSLESGLERSTFGPNCWVLPVAFKIKYKWFGTFQISRLFYLLPTFATFLFSKLSSSLLPTGLCTAVPTTSFLLCLQPRTIIFPFELVKLLFILSSIL